MYVRRRAKKYECLLRYKGARFQKSFVRRSAAVRWGHRTIAELDAGTYIDRDKIFQGALEKKLTLCYEAMKWSQPVDKQNTLERFF